MQVISHVVIGLRTVKGTKQLKLDPTIYDALQKEKVMPGDVIYIEANSGAGHGPIVSSLIAGTADIGRNAGVQRACFECICSLLTVTRVGCEE